MVIETNDMMNEICEKGYRNKPLAEKQKLSNQVRPRIRSRVEHIFGLMEEGRMNRMFTKVIELAKTHTIVGLMNLTYNTFRLTQLAKLVGNAR